MNRINPIKFTDTLDNPDIGAFGCRLVAVREYEMGQWLGIK